MGDPLETVKKLEVLKLRFLNSVTEPKNVIGDPLGFFNIHCVAKYSKKIEGETLWWNPNSFKKSRIVPKKSE